MAIDAVKNVQTNIVNLKNKTSLTSKPEVQNKDNKNVKVLLMTGLVALGAVGVYLATRGKAVSQNKLQNTFTPAKSLEEAKKFAKDKLGVIFSDEAGKFDDIEIVNFINEWLFTTHNKMGSKSYPKFIFCNNKSGIASTYENEFIMDGINYGRPLSINLNYFKDFKNRVINKYMPQLDILKKNSDGKYIIAKPEYDCEYTRRLVKYANAENLSFKDKMQCIADLKAFESRTAPGIKGISENGIYRTLNHEQGHFLHFGICEKLDNLKNFQNDNEISIARKVSRLATKNPLEFVADTFAGLKDGKVFDDDVMSLYKKYNGPTI